MIWTKTVHAVEDRCLAAGVYWKTLFGHIFSWQTLGVLGTACLLGAVVWAGPLAYNPNFYAELASEHVTYTAAR